jgi:threonine dehydrogenase-like Zn-dependent dehydrogenase
VIISAVIACGTCAYCKRGEWSCCDNTNSSQFQEWLHGHRTAALFGYSDTLGGFDGSQAEYARVPFADVNMFKIPSQISDAQALTCCDIACTGFHGCELAEVKEGDNVVVFGCGPVGLMCIMWCKHRKAARVIAIDVDQNRLDFAQKNFGVEVINAGESDPVKKMPALIPSGPDKVIDCVGFRFPDNLLHKIERALYLETDSPNIVNSAIEMVRKNGIIALIGDYLGYANHFNIGGLMEKHLTIRGGQLWAHAYIEQILDLMASGAVDPTVVFTHKLPLSRIDEGYQMFDNHSDNMLKILILPDTIYASNENQLADQLSSVSLQ